MSNKTLILSNSIAGLFSFRKEVFQAFRENDYEVYISCPVRSGEQKAAWFESIGCKVIDTEFSLRGTSLLADFKLILQYRKLLKQINPSVVLSYTIKPNLYGGMACAMCGIPQIVNITGLGAAVEYPGWMQRFTIFLYKIGLRKTALAFFQNADNRQFCLDHGMVNCNTQLIPGSGVNLQYHAQQEFPSEDSPIRFVFVSRIRREKGIDEYLATAESIRQKYQNTEFHVVGGCEGDYEERLKSLHEKGIIIFHGSQPDVRPFYGQAQCTIHPTFYPEGMSNVLLESCATGRAIITTDRAGCREVVDDGVNGFIVNQQDSKDLIEKVEKFLHLSYEDRKSMGLAARQKVEREFDRRIIVDAYLKAVEEISGR